ncbi:unnamed protein product [Durusdinium trenchii]|uniref:Uncharacterized protein n=1 Tax=Durusdinium trenchii TaxID=1381693 RepID=A0ABP0RD78_9DINO
MANGRWAAVCGCEAFKNSSGHALSPLTDALQRLADVGRCWDLARKIPPELYAAAHVVFQAFQAEASQGKDPNIAATRCAPGAFTAMLVLLLLWEAHDAPDELVDTALDIILPIEQTIVAPAMTALGTAGVLDCNRFGNIQDGWWPGVLDLRWLRRLTSRLSRKRAAWQLLAETGQEPWHEREVAEQRFFAEAEFNLDRPSLCLCILHGEGAATLRETLESYKDGGLLEMARRRFVVFLKSLQEDVLDQAVHCWRQEVAKLYDLEPIVPVKDWPDPFIRKHQRHGNPGAAMAACASTCDQDDFQLVTRPAELVQHRFKAAFHMLNETANEAMKIFGVHLRHKLFFGPPFYEMLTARQHGEPPSPYTAWYFHPDPVAASFPDNLWEPPFWDSGDECDSNRRSWHKSLQFQHLPAFHSEQSRQTMPAAVPPGDEAAARVWWCGSKSSLLCTSTAAHRDPFRSLMYSTNPMLFRTETWRLHVMSYMTLLQDLRAVEEAFTSSYTWRVDPSFVLGLSLGLFRHRRLDRRSMPDSNEDPLAAGCIQAASSDSPWIQAKRRLPCFLFICQESKVDEIVGPRPELLGSKGCQGNTVD